MGFIVAALVLVGGVAFLNLVLTLALVRRLRAMTVPGPDGAPDADAATTVPQQVLPGQPIRPFSAPTTDGSILEWSDADPAGTLFVFFSTLCGTCWRTIPSFAATVAERGLTPDQVVAVVVGDPREVADEVEFLGTISRVVVEEFEGPVAAEFGGVTRFPYFVLTDGHGKAVVGNASLQGLPQVVRA